jgi:hypothetical protein
MGAGGEQLHRLEAMARHEREMVARQPVVVKEVRGEPEAPIAHGEAILT